MLLCTGVSPGRDWMDAHACTRLELRSARRAVAALEELELHMIGHDDGLPLPLLVLDRFVANDAFVRTLPDRIPPMKRNG